MSGIKQLCPKCYSEALRVKSAGEIEVTFDINDNGEVIPSIVQTIKETEADFSEVTCACGHTTTIDQLAQGRQSSVSGKWYPIEKLVAWADEKGNEMIGTQEELDSLTAPSIEDMNEEQLREHAKTQDATIASMQEQMAQMMAMMQQLQNGASEPAKEEPKKKEKPAPAPKPIKAEAPAEQPAQEEKNVDTNIPSADSGFEVVGPSGENNAGEFEVIDVTGDVTGGTDDIFEEDEAPF